MAERPSYPHIELDAHLSASGLDHLGHAFLSPYDPIRLCGTLPAIEAAFEDILLALRAHGIEVTLPSAGSEHRQPQ